MYRLTKYARIIILIAMALGTMEGCASPNYPKEKYIVKIVTSKGDMIVELFSETPEHRDNFLKHAREGYYEGLAFHRVIKDFMIQSGDPETRNMQPGRTYGKGGPGYTVPAEFRSELFHKKGALSAARQGDAINPERRSSGSQFYIVQGKVLSDDELAMMEQNLSHKKRSAIAYKEVEKFYRDSIEKLQILPREEQQAAINRVGQAAYDVAPGFTFSPDARQAYTTLGGSPHLDGEYTVFGQVIEGLEIIDAIAASPTDKNDCPLKKIEIIRIEILQEPKVK